MSSPIGATRSIQIFDQDGNFIAPMASVRPSQRNLLSKDDTRYSVDSQSDETTHLGVKGGIRIGGAKDGSVKAFIPDTSSNPQIALAEAVSADAQGDIYAASVSSMGLHFRRCPSRREGAAGQI